MLSPTSYLENQKVRAYLSTCVGVVFNKHDMGWVGGYIYILRRDCLVVVSWLFVVKFDLCSFMIC